MTSPTFYSFRRCPYAMRARLALYASSQSVELREIVLRDKPAHMLEISPKGTIPVLLLPNGTVIDESLDIIHWALNNNDPHNWLNNYDNALITQNDTAFKSALDRYKYPNRFEGEDCTNAFDNAAIVLNDLNARIEANNGALCTPQNTLTDYAIFPFIRQFANVDKERFNALKLPHLQNWLTAHLESDLFNAIMPKFTSWQEGDEPLIFSKA
jgi:glutathione S-transferase